MTTASTTNKEALFIPDDTRDIETNRIDERIFLEENSTVRYEKTFGNSFRS
jgi:hypothetical protein